MGLLFKLSDMLMPLLILATSFLTVQSEILFGPNDTEAVVGIDVTLRCSLATQQSSACSVEWTYKRRTKDIFQTIYTRCFMIGDFETRYSVVGNASIGDYHLKIKDVRPEDFGIYTCRDNTDFSYRRAQLIVFDSYPSNEFCSVIAPHDGPIGNNTCGIEPDEVKLSCNMSFSGNAIPIMEWIQADGDVITSNVTTTLYSNGVTVSSLVLNAAHVQSTAYTCQIRYQSPEIKSSLSWSKNISIVEYMTNRLEKVMIKTSSKELDCAKAGSYLNCSYSWEYEGKILSSSGSVLNMTEKRRGIYTCSAVCNIRGQNCSSILITIEVSSDQLTEWKIIFFLLLTTVQSLVVIILCLILIRCMRMKKEANSVMIHSTTTIKPADNIDTALSFSAVTADQCGYSYNL